MAVDNEDRGGRVSIKGRDLYKKGRRGQSLTHKKRNICISSYRGRSSKELGSGIDNCCFSGEGWSDEALFLAFPGGDERASSLKTWRLAKVEGRLLW